MSLLKIAWRNVQRRALASTLTALSMSLGVMLIVMVLVIHGVVSESFRGNSSLGYNMIVGAKGGRLQLVLNTVYHLSSPVENIPYTFYQEFLPAAERRDGRDGEFSRQTQLAIPVCLGDYYQSYRVVGTTSKMFDDFEYDLASGKNYVFAKGQNFAGKSPRYGYFEAIIGGTVAREAGLKIGDGISPTHAEPDGAAHDKFYVVGILKPSGTPNDRAVFINMEGFYLIEGHAKPVDNGGQAAQSGSDPPKGDDHHSDADGPHTGPHHDGDPNHDADRQPLPIAEREVTAVLVLTVNDLVTPGLHNTINEGPVGQAVLPIAEIYNFFRTFVDPVRWILLFITAMICVVSGVSILVSIYNSMSERRHELAVIRALGASRPTVMMIVLLESVFLSLGGGLIGWIAGHGLMVVASPWVEAKTGVSIGLFDVAPPVKILEFFAAEPIINPSVSTELLLVPGLVFLAVLVGLFPAIGAYRTDVAKSLSANP